VVGTIAYTRLRPRQRAIPRPFNAATVLHPPGSRPSEINADATVLHKPEKPRRRVRVKVIRTVDPTQVREQIVTLPCVIGPEGDFTIAGDVKISRAHVQIGIENDRFTLTDLNSTNGTFVGDTRLEKNGAVPFAGPTRVGVGPNTTVELEPRE